MTKRARRIGSVNANGRDALREWSQCFMRMVVKANTNGRIASHEYTSRPIRIIVFANALSHISPQRMFLGYL